MKHEALAGLTTVAPLPGTPSSLHHPPDQLLKWDRTGGRLDHAGNAFGYEPLPAHEEEGDALQYYGAARGGGKSVASEGADVRVTRSARYAATDCTVEWQVILHGFPPLSLSDYSRKLEREVVKGLEVTYFDPLPPPEPPEYTRGYRWKAGGHETRVMDMELSHLKAAVRRLEHYGDAPVNDLPASRWIRIFNEEIQRRVREKAKLAPYDSIEAHFHCPPPSIADYSEFWWE